MQGLPANFMETLKQCQEKPTRISMPITTFRRDVLPLFSSERTDLPVATWVKIAGGYYNEVDVVDQDGNVVYVLPALLNRMDSTIVNDKDMSMDNVMKEGKRVEQFGEVHQEKLYVQAFDKKYTSRAAEQAVINAQRWNVILAAENYPLIKLPDGYEVLLPKDAPKVQDAPSQQVIADDELDFL